jgi:hypothetical protein
MIETALETLTAEIRNLNSHLERIYPEGKITITDPDEPAVRIVKSIPEQMAEAEQSTGPALPPAPPEPPADLPKKTKSKEANGAPTAKEIKNFVAQRLAEGHDHSQMKASLNKIAPSIDDLDENGRRQFMNYLQGLRKS